MRSIKMHLNEIANFSRGTAINSILYKNIDRDLFTKSLK